MGIVVPMLSVVGRLSLTVLGTKPWVWVLLWVRAERVNRAGSLTVFILSLLMTVAVTGPLMFLSSFSSSNGPWSEL